MSIHRPQASEAQSNWTVDWQAVPSSLIIFFLSQIKEIKHLELIQSVEL